MNKIKVSSLHKFLNSLSVYFIILHLFSGYMYIIHTIQKLKQHLFSHKLLKSLKHFKHCIKKNYISNELLSSSQFFLDILSYILNFQKTFISSHGFLLLVVSIYHPVNLKIHANILVHSSVCNRLHKTTRVKNRIHSEGISLNKKTPAH